jgi:ribonuclease J
VKPRFFIPIHGEYRHLVKHAQLALDMGIPNDRILLAENGDVAVIEHDEVRLQGRAHAGRILVDGKGVGDVGELVLRDRRRLSGDGMVIALLAVDEQSGHIIYGPDIISRGFVFEDREDFILEEAKCVVLEVIDELEGSAPVGWAEVGSQIKRRLKRFFYKVIERRPLILPIIIPV